MSFCAEMHFLKIDLIALKWNFPGSLNPSDLSWKGISVLCKETLMSFYFSLIILKLYLLLIYVPRAFWVKKRWPFLLMIFRGGFF